MMFAELCAERWHRSRKIEMYISYMDERITLAHNIYKCTVGVRFSTTVLTPSREENVKCKEIDTLSNC